MAGAQLLELRSSPEALSIAKYVLGKGIHHILTDYAEGRINSQRSHCIAENSPMPATQFHAISMLQHVLLERHTEMPPAERAQWRAYLATFLVNKWDRLGQRSLVFSNQEYFVRSLNSK